MPMRPFPWHAILAIVVSASCQAASGRLQLGVAESAFRTQAIPDATSEIRVAVLGAAGYGTKTVLSKANSRTLIAGIPTGPAQVGAVAFDAKGIPLAGARTDTAIKSGEKTVATLTLVAGSVDDALLAMVGRLPSAPGPSPSASPGASAGASPPSGAAPATSPAAPVPAASTTPAGSTAPSAGPSVPTTIAPPADATVGGGGGGAAGGGGGVLASATPSPAGGVTVLPGNAYSGPVTVLP